MINHQFLRFNCSCSLWLFSLWHLIHLVYSLVAPPHLLACPGAQDKGSQAFCKNTGNISFQLGETSVFLDEGFITVWAIRQGGAFGPIQASFTTIGSDESEPYFFHKSGDILWGPYDAAPKAISIYLTNSSNSTIYSITFRVALQVTSPLSLRSRSIPDLLILVKDTRVSTGVINFVTSGTIVVPSDTVGTIQVAVSRSGGSGCNASVTYQTVPVPGFDFGHYGGTYSNYGQIFWPQGDQSNRNITIQIIPNPAVQGTPERFHLELVSPACAPLAPSYGRLAVTVLNRNVPGVLQLDRTYLVFNSGAAESVATIPVSRVGGSAGVVSVEYTTVPDSAAAGVQFRMTSGILLWPPSDAGTRLIPVTVLRASSTDPNPQTQFLVRLIFVAGTSIQGPNIATVVIQNTLLSYGLLGFQQELPCSDPVPPGNCIYAIDSAGTGRNRSAVLVLLRRGGSQGIVSVGIQIQADVLLTNLTSVLRWGHLDSSPKVLILPLNELRPTRNDSAVVASVTLFNPDPTQRSFVDPAWAQLSVVVVAQGSGGFFSVSCLNASLSQGNSGVATFSVRRSGFALGNATVLFETVSGSRAVDEISCDGLDCDDCQGLSSAYPGQSCSLTFFPFLNAVGKRDYVPMSGNVSWGPGDTSERIVKVQILNDYIYSYQDYFKYFSLRLSRAYGSMVHEFAIDENHQEAIACITDDNAPTGRLLYVNTRYDELSNVILESATSFSFLEENQTVQITVQRKGGNAGNISVDFRTLQIPERCNKYICPAEAGKHFISTQGQLEWYEGDQSDRQIPVRILHVPGWNVSGIYYRFQIILENITVFSGRQKAKSYLGPQQVFANLTIEESDGPGFATFEVSHLDVQENVGHVSIQLNRVGGRKQDLTVLYSTKDGSAQAPLGQEIQSFPVDCRSMKQSGIARVMGADGIREVYCEMTDYPGSASIFHWDQNKSILWDRQCVIVGAAEGGFRLDQKMDTELTSQGRQSGTSTVLNWQHSIQTPIENQHSLRPFGMGKFARPVSFPLNNITVWFDWESRSLVWNDVSNLKNISFDTLGIDGTGGMNDSRNEFYFISDGINTVHLGCINITSQVPPGNYVWNSAGVHGIYGPEKASVYADLNQWEILVLQNEDDAFVSIPDFGFDFIWIGKNYRSSAFIGSNGYITFGYGSTEYFNLSLWNPPYPSIHFGSADNSWQLVAFKRIYEGEIKGIVIRYEGTTSMSGTLSKPNFIAEISFFADGRIRVIKAQHARKDVSLFLLTEGAGQFGALISSNQSQTFNFWTQRPQYSSNSTVLQFDWNTGQVQREKVSPLAIDVNSLCRLQVDAYGHMLWTVNGRVMYRDCTLRSDASSLHVVLGGTLRSPNSRKDSFSFSKCPSSYFEKCKRWTLNAEQSIVGHTLFSNVDHSGFVYFGDVASGYSNGLFQCGTQQFGVARTDIELGLSFKNDYEPSAGAIVWNAGDVSPKFIDINIFDDRVVDHQVVEYFMLELTDPSGHTIVGPGPSTAVIGILDVHGAGKISPTTDPSLPSPLPERGYSCGSSSVSANFCAHWNIARSSSRGAVCVDVSPTGNMSGPPILNAVPARHFIFKIETVCWSHEDQTTKNVFVGLVPNYGYDTLYKSFNLTLTPTSNLDLQNFDVNGSNYWSRVANVSGIAYYESTNLSKINFGALLDLPAIVTIYDMDAQVGQVTFSSDLTSGNSIFSVQYDQYSATLLVQRLQGQDTDLSVYYSTEMVSELFKTHDRTNNSISRIPISVSAIDGSNGSNIFCSALESRAGTCFDSSSNVKCDLNSRLCSFLLTVEVDAAVGGNGFNTTLQRYQPVDFLPSAGFLHWKEGDHTPRGIAVPVFHPNHTAMYSDPISIYRGFGIILVNASSSQMQNGMRATLNASLPLPPRRFYEDCNLCPQYDDLSAEYQGQSKGFCVGVICPCQHLGCRNSSSSSALVVLPATFATSGSFRLLNTTYFIPENISSRSVLLTVQRLGGYSGLVSVDFQTFGIDVANLSVSARSDEVTFVNGTLFWQNEDKADKYISIPIINDGKYTIGRLTKSFQVTLVRPSQGAYIEEGFENVTQVVVDDDCTVGAFVFSSTLISANENDGVARIGVARVGGNESDVFVRLESSKSRSWDSISEQSGSSDAFSKFLVDQSYACYSMMEGLPTGSMVEIQKVFDFNLTSEVDSDVLPGSTQYIAYSFPNCKLAGTSLSGYLFNTIPDGPCPRHWTFEATSDNLLWETVHTISNGTCDVSESFYHIFTPQGKSSGYKSFKWTFFSDSFGTNRLRLSEISLSFDVGTTNMIPATMCNISGDCCQFQGGKCNPLTGHNLMLRNIEYDYEFSREILSWKDGEEGIKFFTVPLILDFLGCTEKTCMFQNQFNDRPSEYFEVTMSHPLSVDSIGELDLLKYSVDLTRASIPYHQLPWLDKRLSTVRIIDDDGPGIFSILCVSCSGRAGYSVQKFVSQAGQSEGGYVADCPILETAVSVGFMVNRSGIGRGPVSVEYVVELMSDDKNQDFLPGNGTLVWAHGDTSPKYFSVLIKQPHSAAYTSNQFARPFKVILTNPSGGAVVSPCQRSVDDNCVEPEKDSVIVNVIDVNADPGNIKILYSELDEPHQYPVDIAQGSVNISVLRSGGSDLPVIVHYSTDIYLSNGFELAAVECTDGVPRTDCQYWPAQGLLTWEDGMKLPQLVKIAVNPHSSVKEDSKFIFRIWGSLQESLPFCGGFDGKVPDSNFVDLFCEKQFSDFVVITVSFRNGGHFGLVPSPWPYAVVEGQDIKLVVMRNKYFSGSVSVEYQTYGGSALPSVNYLSASKRLSWLENDNTSRIISIPTYQILPANAIVDLYVRLIAATSNSIIIRDQQEVHVVIHGQSASYAPQFILCDVFESTRAQSELNQVSFKFATNAFISQFATITITGLEGTNTYSSSALDVIGADAGKFGNVSGWDQSSGILNLTVREGEYLAPETVYTFSIKLKNPTSSQAGKLIGMKISVVPICNQLFSSGLSCPETISITSVGSLLLGVFKSSILQGNSESFSVLRVSSHLCPYMDCPHAPYFGARNYLFIQLQPTSTIPSQSWLTIRGMERSSTLSGNLSVRIINVSSSSSVQNRNETSLCVCTWEDCGCSHVFSGIPRVASAMLMIRVQCNYLGRALQVYGDEALLVRVGNNHTFTRSTGLNFDNSCFDQCDVSKEIFSTPLNISDLVSDSGLLFVSMITRSSLDYCGESQFLKAEITVSWATDTLDIVDLNCIWNQVDGSIVFTLPPQYSISAGLMAVVVLSLENPNIENVGSSLSLEAISSNQGTIFGPSSIAGTVLIADREPEISFASFDIFSRTESAAMYATDILQFKILFNGPLGGSAEGLQISIDGLKGYMTESDNHFPIIHCEVCELLTALSGEIPISPLAGNENTRTVGTGIWRRQDGRFDFYLQGMAPTFLIPNKVLVGAIVLQGNINSTMRLSEEIQRNVSLTASGEPVRGSGMIAARPMLAGGCGKLVLPWKAISEPFFAQVEIEYADSVPYMPPNLLNLSFELLQTLQPSDRITIRAPSLTTCSSLCYDEICTYKNGSCMDIGPVLVQGNLMLPPNSTEDPHSVFVFYWNEEKKEIELTVHRGRAIKSDYKFQALIHTAIFCDDYECALKLVPNQISTWTQQPEISIDVQRCPPYFPYYYSCHTMATAVFTKQIENKPGVHWAQFSVLAHSSQSGQTSGRVWFAAQAHFGALYVIGGISYSGFEKTIVKSLDGKIWNETIAAPPLVFGRAFFPALSYDGYLWIFGGKMEDGTKTSDVWKSADGDIWCQVTIQATWSPRQDHVVLNHSNRLWVLGGLSEEKIESDVWHSSDGMLWGLATLQAAFSGRSRFSAVSFNSRIWVFGGGLAADGVWFSHDGIIWSPALFSTPWSKRYLHQGLVYQNRIWVVGSLQNTSQRDVWSTGDGFSWNEATNSAAFGTRTGYSAVVFDKRLWVIGGAAPGCDDMNATSCFLVAPSSSSDCERLHYVGYYKTDACQLSDVWMNTYKYADFLMMELSGSSNTYGAHNIVNLMASLDSDLEIGASIVIDGLDSSRQDIFGSQVIVTGVSASNFNYSGFWRNTALVLKVTVPILKQSIFSISLDLQNIVRNQTFRDLSVTAFSAHFDSSTGYPWASESSLEPPKTNAKLSSRSELSLGFDEPYADIYVNVMLGRDILSTSSMNSNQISPQASSAENSSWLSYVDPHTALFYNSVLNYSIALGAWLPDVDIRVAGFCRSTSCYDCSYDIISHPANCSLQSTSKNNVAGDSVTLVFLLIFDELVADKILSNEGCFLGMALQNINYNFSMNAVEYYNSYSTFCPAGYLNSSEKILLCFEPQRIFDGGIMFDIDVLSNIFISSFEIDKNVLTSHVGIEETILLYYKSGSYLQQRKCEQLHDNCSGSIFNLSEWRYLGKVSVDSSIFSGQILFDISGLDTKMSNDNIGLCTSEASFNCQPGQQATDDWLGPQPTWAQDSLAYMSSKFDESVNITGVLVQSNWSIWHSGGLLSENDSADLESGCPNLPKCPEAWPYNKNQWLAFDLKKCYQISGFRTKFPQVDLAPTYKYQNLTRMDRYFSNLTEKQAWWARAQYKDFSFQYSHQSIDGPWSTALNDQAQISTTDWQEFFFQPITARFWKLMMYSNFGFGYIALEGIEFFGSESIWCQDSAWCETAVLCDTRADDTVSVAVRPTGYLQDNGLGLTAGVHSFYLRSTLGSGIGGSARPRGTFSSSDENLVIKEGSAFENNPPFYAWERGTRVSNEFVRIQLHNLASEFSKGSQSITIHLRFKAPDLVQTETLLTLGDICSQGLGLQILGGYLTIVQGCGTSAQSQQIPNLGAIVSGQSYCASFSLSASRSQARLEKLSMNAAQASATTEYFSPVSIPQFSEMIIGAATLCGLGRFSGSILGVSLYGIEQNETKMRTACRRTCAATSSDGSCLDSSSFKLEQNILTSCAADAVYMTLPSPAMPCFEHFRLQVPSISVGNKAWCLQELSLFQSNAPYWQDVRTLNTPLTLNCSHVNGSICNLAFDGLGDGAVSGGNIDAFCTPGSENDWIAFDFGSRVCLTGYALLAPVNISKHKMPSAWSMQGSDDGLTWTLLDSQSSVTFRRNMWRKYSFGLQSQPYIFFPQFYDSVQTFSYNILSKLYRWTGEAEGWALAQEISTNGARKAEYFAIDGDHFLVVASARDSSLIADARTNDGRATDSQVLSDIFIWTGNQFVAYDSLGTNNSVDIKYFRLGKSDYLISADNRIESSDDTSGVNIESSILFSRQRSYKELECNSTLFCRSCSCSTMWLGGANASSTLESDHDPFNAFDGDSSTFWRGIFPDLFVNISLTWVFEDCSLGAYVAAYSILTTEKSCPRSWELYGSNDEMLWNLLDTRQAQSCLESTRSTTFVLSPRFDQRLVTGSDAEPNIHAYRYYKVIFMNPGWGFNVENEGGYHETAIEVSEIEFIFLSSSNAALIATEVPWTVSAYDFSAYDIPYSTVYHDSDGFNVPGLVETKFNYTGVFNTFDVKLIVSVNMSDSNACVFTEYYRPGKLWNTGVSPFLSCTSYWDLCSENFAVCFLDSTTNESSRMSDDSQIYQAPVQKYLYKISFKSTVRLISLRMRGCGWCNATISVMDQTRTVLARKIYAHITDCYSCISWRLKIDSVGKEFYLSEENMAHISLRAAISFDYETLSEWSAVQLLPTKGANDFEYFAIEEDSFLVVANYRDYNDCYGEIECVNPQGSMPASKNKAMPFDIDSTIFRYSNDSSNGLFVSFQNISTHGALDWEHFVLDGNHYLAVANSFTSVTSSPACMSEIYVWNTSTYSFVLFQQIATYGARKWKQFEKDGAHFLAVANTFHSDTSKLDISLYRWLGSYFMFAGNLPQSVASSITVFKINFVTYVVVANIHGPDTSQDMYLTNSSIYRWEDSARFLGAIFYTNAYALSSEFVVKSITSNSSIADSVSTVNVSLACNSIMLQRSLITIGGLLGSQTETAILNLSGPGSHYFNFHGSWNKESGTLVLALVADVANFNLLEFSFNLMNGAGLAGPVRPFVACSGNTNIAARSMRGSVLGVDNLLEATFTERIVSESSKMQKYPNNKISVRLKANRLIPLGTWLTVSNLSGALFSSSNLNVSGPNATLFERNGKLLADSVSFKVAQPIPSFAAFQIDFPVNNGPKPQSPRTVIVDVRLTNGDILFGPFQCNGLVLSFEDSPNFLAAVIQGSNNINGSTNTIFVSLQPGIPIPRSGRITIVGLLQPNRNIGDVVLLRGAPRDLYKFRERKALLFASSFSSVVDSIIFEINETMSNLVPTVFSFQLQNYFDKNQPLNLQNIRVTACLSRDNPGYGSLSSSTSCEIPLQDMTNTEGDPVQLILSNGTNVSVLSLRTSQVATTLSELELIRLGELTIEMWLMIMTDPINPGPVRKQILSIGNSVVVGFNLGGSAQKYAINVNISSSDIPGLRQWFHITARWASDTGIASYFINGVLKSNLAGVLAGSSLLLSGKLALGSRERYVTLKMAQVRIWSLALTDQNIIWTPSKTSFAFLFLHRLFIPRAIVANYDFQYVGHDASTFGHRLNITSLDVSNSFPSSSFRLNEYIYPSALLSNLAITSSSKLPSGDTCINVTFSSNIPFGSGVKVFVYGLLGTQTYISRIPIFATASGSTQTIFSEGTWDNIVGTLSLTLETVLKINSVVSVSFTLINSAFDQAGQQAYISIEDGLIFSYGDIPGVVGNATLSGLALESDSRLLNISCNIQSRSSWLQGTCAPDVLFGDCPLYKANSWGNSTFPKPCDCLPKCPIAAFKSAPCSTSLSTYWRPTMQVADSTSQPGRPNYITFKLQPDRSLQPGTIIRINGLTGTGTENKFASSMCSIMDDCFLQISGPSANSFVNVSGSWLKNAGELRLWLQVEMKPLSEFEFSILVINGINNQDYVVPTIEVIGSVSIPETKMCGQILRILPSIVKWANFAESNCEKCLLNTVRISFMLNANLAVGTGITISNMTGLLVQSGPLAIQGSYSYKLQDIYGRAGIAIWNLDDSSLMLYSRLPFVSGEIISFQVVVLNGYVEQQAVSPVLTLASSGGYHSSPMTGNGLTFQGHSSLMDPSGEDNTKSSWVATGWYMSKNWLITSFPWRKRATGACCVGRCCSLQSCCSCSDTLRNPDLNISETGIYFVGSVCEMFCDRRIYIFGGNMNDTGNLNYAQNGQTVWNSPVERSSSTVTLQLNQTYYSAIVAEFGPNVQQMGLPITRGLSIASPADACTDSQGVSATNKILIIRRGQCDFTHQIRQAQYAGAVAAIVFNYVADQSPFVMQSAGTHNDIIIPALMTSYDVGMALVASTGQNLRISFPASSTPASPNSRIGHSAASVDKIMYVYGGEPYTDATNFLCESGNFLKDFWAFDPVSASWTDITDSRGPEIRCGHSLIVTVQSVITTEETFLYGNTEQRQRIILLGGKGINEQISGELWSFDPLKYVWTNQSEALTLISDGLPLMRWAHCTAAFGENIYMFGGIAKNGSILSDFWLLVVDDVGAPKEIKDLTLLNYWHLCTVNYHCEYPSGRWGHSSAAVSVKASDEEKMQATHRVYSLQDVFVFKIYMFGGSGANSEVLGDFWMFDPIKNVWTEIHNSSQWHSPPPRWGHATVGAGGKFYVIGGKGNNNETLRDVWCWDPEVPGWEDITGDVGPGKRWGFAAVAASDFRETIWALA